MITGIKKSSTPFGAVVMAVLFLIFVSIMIISGVTSADDGKSVQGGTLLTIHDRGIEKIIVTNAETIGDALKEADITIDTSDAVEPVVSQKLVASDYQVNIYRARPIIVVDGNIRQKIMTPYQTADQIAKSAGIILYAEDKAVVSAAENLADGASMQLTITRATPFTFNLYGNTTTVRTQAKTVGAMLAEKGIKLSAADKVSIDKTAAITEGLSVRVWREGKQTITVNEEVAFEVEQIKNADQPISYREVTQLGVKGSRSVTYEVTMENGIEVSRVEIAAIEVTHPSKQIEVIGIKATTPDEARVLGHNMMLAFGYGEDQWACLESLWTHESGWRVSAGNTSSGAYGIPQSLPANKMSAYGNDYLTNASTQITWGLNYIKGRYSTPCGALEHWKNYNWY